jgi:hypothetical protein
VEDGHEYYKSKGGSMVHVTHNADGTLGFAGGWQLEHENKHLKVDNDEIYTKTNGKSYQLNEHMPLGSQKTVYMTLKAHEEFTEFLNLLDHDGANLLSTKLNNKYVAGQSTQGNKNLRLLDNYNYTVYVPTNASIRKLIDDGLMPTWDDYDNAEELCESMGLATDEAFVDSVRGVIKDIIVDFLRYHIQDHSVAVNMAPEEPGVYTSQYESMKRNLETGRFYPINVDFANSQISVTDMTGQTHHVVKTEGLYNQICREYWFDTHNNNSNNNGYTIFMASDAVVHQIDGVLLYDKLTPWKQQLTKIRRK